MGALSDALGRAGRAASFHVEEVDHPFTVWGPDLKEDGCEGIHRDEKGRISYWKWRQLLLIFRSQADEKVGICVPTKKKQDNEKKVVKTIQSIHSYRNEFIRLGFASGRCVVHFRGQHRTEHSHDAAAGAVCVTALGNRRGMGVFCFVFCGKPYRWNLYGKRSCTSLDTHHHPHPHSNHHQHQHQHHHPRRYYLPI